VEKIETFAMAALAGIGLMPDTIEDRAAVIRMRRRATGEKVAPYRVQRDRPRLDDLRQRDSTNGSPRTLTCSPRPHRQCH
jgi:hypothetical protein